MDLITLQQRFASSHFLRFEESAGLQRVHVATPAATATLYLQGAHLTAWQPRSQKLPVIFTSRRSEFAPGEAIRGGIPIVFPWFANDSKLDRLDGKPGPFHGFARTSEWTLASAAQHGSDVALTFVLEPNVLSRSLGFDHFRLVLVFTIGVTLKLALTVSNTDDKPLMFEEAFHSYFHVTDVHEATVTGLEPTPFIDKTDNFKVKPATGAAIHFTAKADFVFLDTAATCVIDDRIEKRRISISKTDSRSTIVFNPWAELPDLGPWEWHEMLAVETANVARNAITLAPGARQTMTAHITLS